MLQAFIVVIFILMVRNSICIKILYININIGINIFYIFTYLPTYLFNIMISYLEFIQFITLHISYNISDTNIFRLSGMQFPPQISVESAFHSIWKCMYSLVNNILYLLEELRIFLFLNWLFAGKIGMALKCLLLYLLIVFNCYCTHS